MALILAVPEQSRSTEPVVSTELPATREWLYSLQRNDPESSLHDLYEKLHALNRLQIEAQRRFQLLELFRVPIQTLANQINQKISHGLLPLQDPEQNAAELVRAVVVEMAFGYKTVVLTLASLRYPNRSSGALCYAIHRSLWYLTASLFQSAMFYAEYPPGTWSEIHTLFAYAKDLELHDDAINDELNSTRKSSSIAHLYKHALLLGLSDPFQMPTAVTMKIHRYLHRWASTVILARFVTPPTTRCQFIIDPMEDHAPMPYARFQDNGKRKGLLLLDTRGITRLAHDQWRDLQAGIIPLAEGLNADFFNHDGIAMLEKAVPAWGVGITRELPREQRREPFELVLGLAAANFCVNKERLFVCGSEEPIATPISLNAMRRSHGKVTKQLWVSVNEHAGGVWLKIDPKRSREVRVRVGDIVALRALERSLPWHVGVVRWARAEESVLNVGLQKISASALPVAVKPVSAQGKAEATFEISLVISGSSNGRESKSLITPRGMFQAQRNLFVDNGEILLMVRATRLIERGVGYEWFAYDEINL